MVTRTDVIYGRVEGSALLANIAWPDGPGLKPAILSVHGGRWRAGNRTDASSIKVAQWAEFGFVAMSKSAGSARGVSRRRCTRAWGCLEVLREALSAPPAPSPRTAGHLGC